MNPAYLQHFQRLKVWKKNGERAPHKPLLALWSIGRCLQGKARLVDYDTAHQALLVLLNTFGPHRKHHTPQEPFWRMQKDQIWEIPGAAQVPVQPGGSVSPTVLRTLKVQGGFPKPLDECFRRNRAAAFEVAKQLVADHFPETMHAAVLKATLGEQAVHDLWTDHQPVASSQSPILESALRRRTRNPKFRKEILETYGYRCAVCKYSFEFPAGNWPALEAAHIKWHSHQGPDEPKNGLSLCVLHHELFDWGVFTIHPGSLDIVVATTVLEHSRGTAMTLFQKKSLLVKPEQDRYRPAPEYLNWHARNVFKGPPVTENARKLEFNPLGGQDAPVKGMFYFRHFSHGVRHLNHFFGRTPARQDQM